MPSEWSLHLADDDLKLTDALAIPAWELQEDFVRASGPGGQNVNKVATAVQLRWNLEASSLPAPIKAKIARRLRSRLTQHGDLIIDAQRHRSQAQNRKDARDRLTALLKSALRPRKRRIPTRPGRGAIERRLKRKKQRGEVKSLRGKVEPDD